MVEETMTAEFVSLQRKRSQRSISLLARLQGIRKNVDSWEDYNADWKDDQVLQLNPEKLMCDIIDRLAMLNDLQWEIKKVRAKSGSKDNDKEENEMVDIKNRVFVAACKMTMSKLGQRPWDENDDDCDIATLLLAVPDETKTKEVDSLLTHWSMLAVARPEYGVTVADVKALVKRDPMSMRKHHMIGVASHLSGLTPAHFLCMQQETDSVMALIRHYAIFNETAFTMCSSYPRDNVDNVAEADCCGALNAACCVRCPSVELLQLLLQLDPSQATKKTCRSAFTPLGVLCHYAIRFRHEGTKFFDAVQCLLSVDNSAEYIGDAIDGLLCGSCRSKEWIDEDAVESLQQHVLTILDMLLTRNPDAAKYRNYEINLLHSMAFIPSAMPPQVCIVIMERILVLHKDAVREADEDGAFPIHDAAIYWPIQVMNFLLGLYPESATAIAGDYHNLLIYLLRMDGVVNLEDKVRFLCSRYPQLVQQKDTNGDSALYWALRYKTLNLPVVKFLCEAGGRELVSAAKISPLPVVEGADQDGGNAGAGAGAGGAPGAVQPHDHGWLPLHMFIGSYNDQLRSCLPFSEAADCLRTLLHWYPEAVGIEAGVGADYRKTPYQSAIDYNVDPYCLRMLLHAVPDLNPADLHRLNYAERRMAMFLAFKAVSTNDDRLLLPRLRFANKDLLKRVISFL